MKRCCNKDEISNNDVSNLRLVGLGRVRVSVVRVSIQKVSESLDQVLLQRLRSSRSVP
jgi:hypothetical protein